MIGKFVLTPSTWSDGAEGMEWKGREGKERKGKERKGGGVEKEDGVITEEMEDMQKRGGGY
jgi:hypothetical protein